MSRLSVSGDALHARARTMRAIVADFSGSGHQADAAVDAVGQAVLASAIHDFASNWSVHRSRTIEALTGLSDAFDAVNQTFADLDGDMARQLRESTSQARAANAEASRVRGEAW